MITQLCINGSADETHKRPVALSIYICDQFTVKMEVKKETYFLCPCIDVRSLQFCFYLGVV